MIFAEVEKGSFKVFCLSRTVVQLRLHDIITDEAPNFANTLFRLKQETAKSGGGDFRYVLVLGDSADLIFSERTKIATIF